MKSILKIFVASTFVAALLLSVSCKGKTDQDNVKASEQSENTEVQAKEYASAYVCPMHCEGSGSDQEGTCPKCGMTYVALEEHEKDGHKHD